jgi:hypothetical protein
VHVAKSFALSRRDAAKRGSALPRQEGLSSDSPGLQGGWCGVEALERSLLQGCSNGTKGASREIRKATQSHAFGSPMPGEHRDMRTARPDEEYSVRGRWIAFITEPERPAQSQ